MTMVAIYARVSSERQKEEHTIGSQISVLTKLATNEGLTVPHQWIFQDEGYSGATLVRPGLERLRDLVCEGQIEKILIYAPDRLSRKYAYQVLLIEEFSRHGVEVVFTNSPQAKTPEERMHLKPDLRLEDLSRMFNPVIRGWINYYGRFYKSALYPVLRHFNKALTKWARRKFKRLARHQRRAEHWLGRIARREPKLFAHWQMGVLPSAG